MKKKRGEIGFKLGVRFLGLRKKGEEKIRKEGTGGRRMRKWFVCTIG